MSDLVKERISITYLRSEETMKRYIEHISGLKNGISRNLLKDLESRAIQIFEHWLIIESDFPYDAIAETTHIIFSKRKVEFDWDKLSKDERLELEDLKSGFIRKNYDVVYENLPNGQTVPGHFHLILLVLKRD